ncbi:MAG: carbohydrate kinase [Bacteroidetes bacterium]|nr:carbohydrate kinase [Bacteroidota bacterium]
MYHLDCCCFGEVLFDVLPERQVVGGASLNVAVWLHRLGNAVGMISRVGEDDLGKELIKFIEKQGLTTTLIGTDSQLATSTVKVALDDKGIATYVIEKPVAWDAIPHSDALQTAVANAKVFVYNSLTVRSKASRETLFKLLSSKAYKVLDVNLRPPHYEKSLLIALMQAADFIKFNDDEIREVVGYFQKDVRDLKQAVQVISTKTHTPTICVTLGGDGVLFFQDGGFYSFGGFKVTVKDTVGAGDSFLAALISSLQKNTPVEASLRFACALGASVASKEGALPDIDLNAVAQLAAC